MAKLSTVLSDNPFVKVMIYGPSGVGKTTFSSSFPGPIWVADFDGKVSSAARYLEVHNPKKLEEIDFENFQPSFQAGVDKSFSRFQAYLAGLEKRSSEGTFPFKTVVVDSLTTFADRLMANIIAENPGVKRVEALTPAMQDYLIQASNFKPLIHRILALPCNIVVIGHLAQDKDETTGEIVYRPALPGKLPELLPILFEEVYRAYTEVKDNKVVYMAQCRPAGKYVARTQIQGMPSAIELSYESIVKLITKKKENTK